MHQPALRRAAASALALVIACGGPGSDAADDTGNPGSAASFDDDGSSGTPSTTGTVATTDAGTGTSEGGTHGSSGAGDSSADDGSTTAVDWVPYFFDDFEAYGDGASLSDFAPFDAAGRTTATTEAAHRGQQSARMAIAAGDGGGFGQWGGVLAIDPAVPRGGEVWVRLWVRWPSAFEFSASPWMKFLRLHDRTADGSNGGYNDLYVDRADETTSVLRTIKEIHDVWAVYDGESLPRDTWERYEMYLFVDDVPVDDGGNARVRIWRDDALIFDRTDVPTITDAGGAIDYFYLFTYWNDEMPPDNHCYVDDLVIATDASPPPFQDAAGNAWIGDW